MSRINVRSYNTAHSIASINARRAFEGHLHSGKHVSASMGSHSPAFHSNQAGRRAVEGLRARYGGRNKGVGGKDGGRREGRRERKRERETNK
eukprot:2712139-Rhodomonas_salina.1